MNDLVTTFQPELLDLLGALIALAIAIAANAIRRWTGIQIEARHREALHSALMSGASAALSDGYTAGRDVMIEKIIAYARLSVPDAIRALAPDNIVIRRLAERFLDEARERLGK